MNFNNPREANNTVFLQTANWFANLLALVIAFLLTPFVYGNSVDLVQRFTTTHYGHGFDDLIAIVWWGLCAGIVFCVARMGTAMLIMTGAFAIASKFFV
jgi:hypothetical protein